MLRWRLLLGTLFIAALVALCWLDFHAPRPGVYLLPLAVFGALLAAGELLGLYRASDGREGRPDPARLPLDSAVYAGTLLIVLVSVVPMGAPAYASAATGWLGWTALGGFLSLLLLLAAEMWRYAAPGYSTLRLMRSFFAMSYAEKPGPCLSASSALSIKLILRTN